MSNTLEKYLWKLPKELLIKILLAKNKAEYLDPEYRLLYFKELIGYVDNISEINWLKENLEDSRSVIAEKIERMLIYPEIKDNIYISTSFECNDYIIVIRIEYHYDENKKIERKKKQKATYYTITLSFDSADISDIRKVMDELPEIKDIHIIQNNLPYEILFENQSRCLGSWFTIEELIKYVPDIKKLFFIFFTKEFVNTMDPNPNIKKLNVKN
jgi:hypothetical protein